MKPAISAHWQLLRTQQAWALVVVGLVLELPVRWVVRPDIPYMVPGSPWFNLPLRIGVELGFVLAVVAVAWAMKMRLPQLGIPLRRWTRWEWVAFAVVGTIELVVVIAIAGQRWPRLFAAGVMGRGLLWATAEYLFGFNQEFVFRGALMTGLLRLGAYWWALFLNTLVFLVGPLHGPGLWHMAPTSPGSPWCNSICIRATLHPTRPRCSSLKYSRYSRSSRLAGRGASPLSVQRWTCTTGCWGRGRHVRRCCGDRAVLLVAPVPQRQRDSMQRPSRNREWVPERRCLCPAGVFIGEHYSLAAGGLGRLRLCNREHR
jgi:hypothetical protein